MIQGEATVPYVNIGGETIDNEATTFGLGGSTNPDATTDPYGTGLSIAWRLPGGIVGKSYNGEGLWGYAVVQKIYGDINVDSTVRSWLMGNEPNAVIQPTKTYATEEALNSAIAENDATIISDINTVMVNYAGRLFDIGIGSSDHDLFKSSFVGCYRAI